MKSRKPYSSRAQMLLDLSREKWNAKWTKSNRRAVSKESGHSADQGKETFIDGLHKDAVMSPDQQDQGKIVATALAPITQSSNQGAHPTPGPCILSNFQLGNTTTTTEQLFHTTENNNSNTLSSSALEHNRETLFDDFPKYNVLCAGLGKCIATAKEPTTTSCSEGTLAIPEAHPILDSEQDNITPITTLLCNTMESSNSQQAFPNSESNTMLITESDNRISSATQLFSTMESRNSDTCYNMVLEDNPLETLFDHLTGVPLLEDNIPEIPNMQDVNSIDCTTVAVPPTIILDETMIASNKEVSTDYFGHKEPETELMSVKEHNISDLEGEEVIKEVNEKAIKDDKDYVPSSDEENSIVSNQREQDYVPSSDEESIVSNQREQEDKENNPINQNDLDGGKGRTRKKKYATAKPEQWKKNINKIKRLQGSEYHNPGRQKKEARSIGKTCQSDFCKKSAKRQCQDIPHGVRTGIFERFWLHMSSWRERRLYVSTCVKRVPIKQKKMVRGSRRSHSLEYYLIGHNLSYQVCKMMFCSTLGISERTIMNWLQAANKSQDDEKTTGDSNCNIEMITAEAIEKGKKKRRVATNATSPEDNKFIRDFLSTLSTVPSHYCRASYAYMKFLEPGTTLIALYDQYKEKAEAQNRRVMSYPVFTQVFHSEHYSVFVPRKDQCDLCLSAKHGAISEEELVQHQALKDRAQQAKKEDKISAQTNPNVSCWTMDLQAVLLCPKTEASCMFYKTKLQVHNFTLFCLESQDGYCYVWDEANGGLSSNIFAWIQYQHFKRYLEKNKEIKILIIWSDGCGYQNRNATVSNAYLHLAKQFKITITQKFLIVGHTQMECDSMHSVIERKIQGPMYCPRDYAVVMQGARKKPKPYQVEQLDYNVFMKGFENAYVSSIRPGKKAGDPVVSNVRAIQYSEKGIEYKLNFDDDFSPLPQRIKAQANPILENLYASRTPIKKRKYEDLQALKHVIPPDLHPYFDGLPYE